METKAHHVLIGAFTLMVIAGAFVLIWFVSGAGGLMSGRVYQVQFKGTVGGLTNGSVVTFNGIRVGEVLSVDLVASDPGSVAAVIKVEGGAPVRSDTRARLESQGLGGSSTVALIGGSPSSPELKGENGKLPVLVGEPSQMANLLENVASLSAKADSVITKADALLTENSAAITDTVKNLDAFSKALGDNAPALNETLASIGDIGKRLGPVADSMDKLVKAVDTDKVQKIVDNTTQLTAKLNSAADKVDGVLSSAQGFFGSADSKGVVGQLGDAAKSIHQLSDDVDVRLKEVSPGLVRFSTVGLREYEGLATDARRTVNDLDRLIHTIETNPSKLFFGK